MASMTLADLCDGIATALGAVSGISAWSYDEVGEAIPSTPLLMVYPESGSLENETGQYAFRGAQRLNRITIYVDVVTRPRSNMAEDMKSVVAYHDLITDELDKQKTGSAFGVTGAKAFTYSWRRVQFDYGGADYVGLRYELEFMVY